MLYAILLLLISCVSIITENENVNFTELWYQWQRFIQWNRNTTFVKKSYVKYLESILFCLVSEAEGVNSPYTGVTSCTPWIFDRSVSLLGSSWIELSSSLAGLLWAVGWSCVPALSWLSLATFRVVDGCLVVVVVGVSIMYFCLTLSRYVCVFFAIFTGRFVSLVVVRSLI